MYYDKELHMKKKVFIILTITVLMSLGIFGLVRSTYAQDVDTTEEAVDLETETEEVVESSATPEQAMYAYENAYGYGQQNGEDPIMTQTQTRTQLRELQGDGECTGECTCDGDQAQLRQQVNAGGQGQGGQQQQLNLGDGTCDGTCDGNPQRMNGNRGN
jgi:hypothetical protein